MIYSHHDLLCQEIISIFFTDLFWKVKKDL